MTNLYEIGSYKYRNIFQLVGCYYCSSLCWLTNTEEGRRSGFNPSIFKENAEAMLSYRTCSQNSVSLILKQLKLMDFKLLGHNTTRKLRSWRNETFEFTHTGHNAKLPVQKGLGFAAFLGFLNHPQVAKTLLKTQ